MSERRDEIIKGEQDSANGLLRLFHAVGRTKLVSHLAGLLADPNSRIIPDITLTPDKQPGRSQQIFGEFNPRQ